MLQLTLMLFDFFGAGKNKDAEGNKIGRGIGDSDLCRFSIRFGRGLTVFEVMAARNWRMINFAR